MVHTVTGGRADQLILDPPTGTVVPARNFISRTPSAFLIGSTYQSALLGISRAGEPHR
jgi:hypothetical protein